MADTQAHRRAVPRVAQGAQIARVAIVGCGQIGSLWDEDAQLPVRRALTHAAAYQSHPHAELVALCDSDEARARAAAQKRGVARVFSNAAELFVTVRPNVVSLCTPPRGRLELIRSAVDNGCGVILCEKPLAASLAEAASIQSLLAGSQARLVLNYQRRWDSGLRAVRRMLDDGELGPIQKAVAVYGKGLANNGSHMIDLCNFFFGAPRTVRALGVVDDDRIDADATRDAQIIYSTQGRELPVVLLATDHRAYTAFELDIHLQRGRIVISDRGQRIDIRRVIDDPVFPAYRILSEAETQRSEESVTLSSPVDEAVQLHRGMKTDISCGIAEGIAVLAVIEAIIRSVHDDGRDVSVQQIQREYGIPCQ